MTLILSPFKLIWNMLTFVFRLVGRTLAIVIGLVLALIGLLLNATGIGAILGVPLMILGVVLVIRGFF